MLVVATKGTDGLCVDKMLSVLEEVAMSVAFIPTRASISVLEVASVVSLVTVELVKAESLRRLISAECPELGKVEKLSTCVETSEVLPLSMVNLRDVERSIVTDVRTCVVGDPMNIVDDPELLEFHIYVTVGDGVIEESGLCVDLS